MRISDWSSDVCSSDLAQRHHSCAVHRGARCAPGAVAGVVRRTRSHLRLHDHVYLPALLPARSEERRVGTECVRTCKVRRSPYHSKNKKTSAHTHCTTAKQ